MKATTQIANRLTDVFWVSGLVVLHIWCVSLWDAVDPEAREWTLYLALGTSFPALVILISGLGARSRTRAVGRGLEQFCAATLALVSIPFLISNLDWTAVWIASAQAALLLVSQATRLEDRSPGALRRATGPDRAALALATGFAIAMSWTLARTLVHWRDLGEMITAGPYSVVAFAISLGTVSLALFPIGRSRARERGSFAWLGNAGAVLVIALFAFNIGPVLSTDSSFEHWAWAAGPAQLVREGGWLLWDVHSTYGLLNTLAIAGLPVQSTWVSLYLLNASLLFLSGLFVFAVFRALRRGVVQFVCALLLAVSATLLLPGHAETLSGVQVYPSVGAFRFFWCYVLLAVLLWDHTRRGTLNRLHGVAWTGNIAWLVGSLWSAESAAYCSAIWIPAYLLILWDALGRGESPVPGNSARFLVRAAPWLSIPVLLFASAVGAGCAWFWLRLGHLPDFTMYIEAALAFGSNFNTVRVDVGGSVWVLVLVFCVVSTLVCQAAIEGGRWRSHASLSVGVFLAVWATGSSYVPHSTSAQVLNLAPIYCVALAVLVRIAGEESSRREVVTVMKVCIVPLLTLVMFSTFGNRSALGVYLDRSLNGAVGLAGIDDRIPLEEADVLRLLEEAGVEPGDRITSLERDLLGRIDFRRSDGSRFTRAEHPAFLPVKPAWALTALSEREHRVRQFIGRWIARQQPGGWLLVPKREPHLAWLPRALAETHATTAEFSNRRWSLLRLEPRDAATADR